MIKEHALVERVEGQDVWVQTQRQSTCGSCAAKAGCGTAAVGKVVGLRSTRVRLLDSKDIAVGDRVVIGLAENAMLRGAFMVYAVPLLLMLLFSAVASWAAYSELVVIASAGLGLLIGMSIVRGFGHRIRYNPAYQPVLLEKITPVECSVVWQP